MRQLQQNNGLECIPVIQTKGSISSGLQSTQVIAFGMGKNLNVWLGWLPHRPSSCRFEVSSNGFIVQVKQEKLNLSWNQQDHIEQSTGLMKSRRIAQNYETAQAGDLEHASVVARFVVCRLAERGAEEQDFVFDGKKLIHD